MRQGKPWIGLTLQCRRQLHALCLHATDNASRHVTYKIWCACDCHERRADDPNELRKIRCDMAARGQVKNRHDSTLPPLPAHLRNTPAQEPQPRLNPLKEHTRFWHPPTPATASPPAEHLPAMPLVCDPNPLVATSSAVLPKTRKARALECRGCQEKRQVIEWITPTRWGDYAERWRLCAPCLMSALSLLLANQTRHGAKPQGGITDGSTNEPKFPAPNSTHRRSSSEPIRRLAATNRALKRHRSRNEGKR